MKKIIWCIVIVFLIIIPNYTYADNELLSSEILAEQQEKFNIKEFLKEAEKYSPDFIKERGIYQIFKEATTGKINNTGILKKIVKSFGIQFKEALKIMVSVLIIVLIHSVLKNITESLEYSSISRIIYYVEYILIVTVIMSNFSEIINSVTKTINNLVGFIQVLIPLLITLMVYTGSITTSGMLEPILVLLIEVIANIIQKLILPVISIIIVLVIVSKISDKIQVSKLSKFIKSSIVWFFGVILTLFVGVISLEGTLTSSVDGITAKTTKAAVSNLIPVVRKNIG